MKLISDIINELMDISIPVTGPLLKTKVLASRIGNISLKSWINGELNGYKEADDLPEYRMSAGTLMGSFLNGNIKGTNIAFPVSQINQEILDEINSFTIKDSLASIEKMVKESGLKISVSSNTKLYIENSIRKMGNPYFQIISIYIQIPAFLFNNILSSVRFKLLDFMLELEAKFGYESDIEEFKSKNDAINNIVSNTILGNSNLITLGSNNEMEVGIVLGKKL